MRIAWLMLFPKDLHGRSFGDYERPISHCSFAIPGGSGSAWNRSSTTRIHSSARSPMSRLVNPVTDAPTVAPLAVLVDFVAGLVNHYRRTSDDGQCPVSRRYGPPWLTAVNTTSCLVVIDPVSSWEPANPHCQGRRHLVDTGRLATADARVIPLQNANVAHAVGKVFGTPFCTLRFAVRRAYQPNALGIVSTKAAPSGGKNAAARIISRTRAGPSLVTTPGTVNPANEWPTMTRSSMPAFSMSDTTESTPSNPTARPPQADRRSTSGLLSCS